MPYYPDINVLFVHIPKTGGRSVEGYLRKKSKQTLLSHFPNRLMPDINLQRVSLQHQYYINLNLYRKKLGIKPDARVFAVVRNPYNRIISDLFFYNKMGKNNNKQQVFNIMKKYLGEPGYKYDNHRKPQFKYVCDENGKIYDEITILKSETLTKDMIEYGFEDYEGLETSPTYWDYLNRDSINLVNLHYKKDFEIFHYDMIV